MKQIILLFITIICFSSCGSSKQSRKIITKKTTTQKTNTYSSTKPSTKSNSKSKPSSNSPSPSRFNSSSKSDKIINYAYQFQGVRYKYGGNTKSGMDCSGLIQKSFNAYDLNLPRSSRDQAQKGHKISLRSVQKGDLLFFKTNPKKNTISHVALVVNVKGNLIEFIHATTSRGVITSNLNENYWNKAFSEARRIL